MHDNSDDFIFIPDTDDVLAELLDCGVIREAELTVAMNRAKNYISSGSTSIQYATDGHLHYIILMDGKAKVTSCELDGFTFMVCELREVPAIQSLADARSELASIIAGLAD